MYFLDELNDMKLYRRKVAFPINEKNKKHGSAVIVLSPDATNGVRSIVQNDMIIPKYFNAYYTERSVLYYVNHENGFEEIDENNEVLTEGKLYKENKINYIGTAGQIKDIKSYLHAGTFAPCYSMFGGKFPSSITVKIEDTWDIEQYDYVSVCPKQYYNQNHFFSYKKFCSFVAWVWGLNDVFPTMNPSLAYAVSLIESGVFDEYMKDRKKYLGWPFVKDLRKATLNLYLYKNKNGEDAYVDLIKRMYRNPKDVKEVKPSEFTSNLKLYYAITSKAPLYEFGGGISIASDLGIVTEDASNNASLKKILYNGRMKNVKQLNAHYANVKEILHMKYMYNSLEKYKGLNVYIDLGYYMNTYLQNTRFSKKKGYKVFTDLISRMVNDDKFEKLGWNLQTVVIPLDEWMKVIGEDTKDIHLINSGINPFSCIYYALLSDDMDTLKAMFGNRDVLFLGRKSYFKVNFSKKINAEKDKLDPKAKESNLKANFFLKLLRKTLSKEFVDDEAIVMNTKGEPQETSSPKAIKANVIEKIEVVTKTSIDNISSTPTVKPVDATKSISTIATAAATDKANKDAEEKEKKKTEIVKTVEKNIATANNEDDALKSIDNNEEDSERLKELMDDLQTNPDNGSDMSGTRSSRMLKLEKDFLDSEFEGKKVSDIINSTPETEPLPEPLSLEVDSVNEEWKNLTFASTLEAYDLDADIVRIFQSFSAKSNPLVIRSIDKKDTSTTGNLVETWTCNYESHQGKRFTITVDIPKFIDNKYMVLRGNRKNIPIQIFLMPIIKTAEDAVQIVSLYKKLFIYRFGNSSGKSNIATDKLLKTLNKGTFKSIKTVTGENSKVCSKYELPLDYIDIASNYSRIETPNYVYVFNQDRLREEIEVNDSKGLCLGYQKKTKEPVYFVPNPKQPMFFSYDLYFRIEADLPAKEKEEFNELYNKVSPATRYTFNRLSVMDTEIPLVVVCGLAVGLEETMRRAKIKYSFHDKKPKYDPITQDVIKFQDAWLLYEMTYSSSMLMNGLKVCNTDDYSMKMVNSRVMYLDFLELFGGRIKADGLDNFADCMVDPVTREVLQHYKLPTDYIDILLYGNALMADNKYVKHGDIRSSRRLRKMEQLAHILYEVLSSAYGAYSTGLKHGKQVGFSVKQSAVIDRLLVGNTTEDQSILNPVGEYESYFAVTPKGPSGMNSERAYSLDKRSYDESMMDILSASTGSAGNVGITRQATVDANIQGTRGYIYNNPESNGNAEVNAVKTLCMTESLTPFTATRDDPMRLAMGFTQTSKHGMRVEKSDPLLITTGADEALPYLISNTFAHKTSADGKVVELTDDYMVIEHTNGENEYINLQEEVQKNSSSGFFITLKLDTDLKVGDKVKKGQIVAYDKKSFSDEMGADENIAYNIGTLAKFAILNTDEGFEDSAIISDALSEGMASDIVKAIPITLPKNTNVLSMCLKGQTVNEGDTLMVIQNDYDEEDLTTIMRNLSADDDSITELGRKTVKSEVTGWVQDIIIERTVELDELSPSLKKLVKSYEKNINDKKAIMNKYKIEDNNKVLRDTKALPPVGSLKNAADGVKITIYLKYHDKFSTGDKLIYGTAVKGVCKDIFPKGEEPYSEFRKDEKLHALLSIGSINARMVTSVLITTGINKFLIEMSRKVKDMAGIDYDINLIE